MQAARAGKDKQRTWQYPIHQRECDQIKRENMTAPSGRMFLGFKYTQSHVQQRHLSKVEKVATAKPVAESISTEYLPKKSKNRPTEPRFGGLYSSLCFVFDESLMSISTWSMCRSLRTDASSNFTPCCARDADVMKASSHHCAHARVHDCTTCQ